MSRSRLLLAALIVLTPAAVWAVDVVITAFVPAPPPPSPAETAVVFRGIAYPSSTVSIHRDGTFLASAPADPAARFDIRVAGQPTGPHTYAVSSTDATGRPGAPMDFALNLTSGVTVTLSGIFLAPTLAVDRTIVRLGETITLLGVTAPVSAVTITIESEVTRTYETTAQADGTWVRQFVADDIGLGDHTARAKATTSQAEISAASHPVAFSVLDREQAPDPCDGKNRADIDCDGVVNLVDFSILLFYWKRIDPANARADINRDRVVDLTDFSILLFNWTR